MTHQHMKPADFSHLSDDQLKRQIQALREDGMNRAADAMQEELNKRIDIYWGWGE